MRRGRSQAGGRAGEAVIKPGERGGDGDYDKRGCQRRVRQDDADVGAL